MVVIVGVGPGPWVAAEVLAGVCDVVLCPPPPPPMGRPPPPPIGSPPPPPTGNDTTGVLTGGDTTGVLTGGDTTGVLTGNLVVVTRGTEATGVLD